MVDYNLDMDESIILETPDVQRLGDNRGRIKELVLTNKHIFLACIKKNGVFAKPTIEVEVYALSDIKIYDERVQIAQIKNGEYGTCLQIQFVQGREIFAFEAAGKRIATEWVNEVSEVLGYVVPQPEKKENPFKGLSGLAASLKNVTDSVTETVTAATKQVMSEPKANPTNFFGGIVKAEPTVILQTEALSNQNVRNPKPKFCTNCGASLNEGAKFCMECGTLVGIGGDAERIPPIPTVSQSPSNGEERQQEYAGKILKCPNCGAVISQTIAICPDCGMKITGQVAVSSVRAFSEQLMSIEATRKQAGFGTIFAGAIDPADQKKLSLVRSFPIPNTVDDIMEFMMLAVANIDVVLSKNTMMNKCQKSAKSMESNITIARTISDAWVSKMQQAYQKAELSFPNDLAFLNIKQMYLDKMKELKIKIG
ncbi:zinc ribbon domain-containing protein [Hespellia stercorisuis]|uniref:Zinc-ribbon domain-containing protein n=1 Tax=Hespellia stercorisuis DSM 15480 TaxID=1121950 RepID=A0A1M6UBQ9_9FIRM|nr:zinc ribbon domain-containing protein [Hespellia stercorisuis]SHK66685.1 zinc-ribbon domain-containing protein [Hespellia stercorisuis DSM 15480]